MGTSESQREINEAEWRNTDNWSGGRLFPVYFGKRDSRLLVGMWWNNALGPTTINLGHRWGPRALALFINCAMAVAAAVGWTASRDYYF